MVNYSVTIDILPTREREWVTYMLQHIKEVLDTGHFVDFTFKKVKPLVDGYERYLIEYFSESMLEYDRFEANGASKLRADHDTRFAGAFKYGQSITEYTDVLNAVFYGGDGRSLFKHELAL